MRTQLNLVRLKTKQTNNGISVRIYLSLLEMNVGELELEMKPFLYVNVFSLRHCATQLVYMLKGLGCLLIHPDLSHSASSIAVNANPVVCMSVIRCMSPHSSAASVFVIRLI